MTRDTIELIGRVRNIIGTNTEFFDAIKEWYGNVKLAQKVIRLMFARSRAGARVLLSVNGNLLAGDAVTVTPQARHVTWVLSPSLLATGDNHITISLDAASTSALYLENVTASQEQNLPRQTVDLSRAEPRPAPFLNLLDFVGVHNTGNCCCVDKKGYLTLRLQLKQTAPVTFSLGIPDDGSDAYQRDLDDVMKDVQKRVRSKWHELVQEYRRAEGFDRRLAERLRNDIADLDQYSELHQNHIEPALHSSPESTLEKVIEQIGDPDRLLRIVRSELPSLEPTQPQQPAPQQFPHEFAHVEVLRPAPRTANVPQPSPRVSTSYRIPRRPTSGGFASFVKAVLMLFTVLGTIGSAGGAALWFLVIQPMMASSTQVTFDSLADGQTVPVGMPLQVWLSAKDPQGVKSLALTVESANPRVVAENPAPDKITFESGTTDTGTKVFTINLKADPLPEARTLTLVATAVNADGKTTTSRRTIKVGGKDQGLAVTINPVEPKEGQGVTVTIHGANTQPGTKVSYKVTATDPYRAADTLTLQPDGTASFFVPGAKQNVSDYIEVQLDGTNLVQKVSYTFR